MDELKFRTQIAHQFGRPGSSWLPGDLKSLPAYFLKEGREVPQVHWCWLKGRGALEDDDRDSQSFGDFERFLPGLPNLLGIAK